MSTQRKIYFLTTLLVSFTIIITFSFTTYMNWQKILKSHYKSATSMSQLLDVYLDDTYTLELLSSKLSKQQKIQQLNTQLQPLIDDLTKVNPGFGAGYYIKELNSIVAFGPNFEVTGLIDISSDSLARTVYQTKKPYEFHNYSQTRKGYVVANIQPLIRNGEVIGHTWGNVLIDDIYTIFKKDIQVMLTLFIAMIMIALSGSKFITHQYIQTLKVFRTYVKNLNLTEEKIPQFPNELMEVYNDIVASQNALINSEARFRDIVTAFNEFVWEVDLDGNYTYLSDKILDILGYSPEELIGTTTFESIHPEDCDNIMKIFASHIEQQTAFRNLEYRKQKKNGEWIYLSTTSLPIFYEQQLVGYRGATRDISLLKEKEQEVYSLAYFDRLTSLPNRNALSEYFDTLLQQGKPFATLFVDLDQFKKVNDTLGHTIGDELLVIVTKRLQRAIGKNNAIFRFGGDEFIIILTDYQHTDGLIQYTNTITNDILHPINIDNHQLFVTLSIGISLYPNHGKDMETLIKNADMAMYKAKDNGRNQFMIYCEIFNKSVVENFEISNDLIEAITSNQFTLHYQPQVNLQTQKIVGVEALVRWIHPTKGMISPAQFIPIAEESSTIITLGTYILRRACSDRKHWLDEGIDDIRVAVNISIKQFEQETFVEQVMTILSETQLDPKYLELEITEGIAMTNPKAVIKKLQQLKEKHIYISIDDFGMGYSSMNYLKQLPIHQLKIDKAFIQDISEQSDFAIVQSIISLAQSLNLTVVAEGVETNNQATILKNLQYPSAQGYFYFKPMPKEDLIPLLKSLSEK